MAVQGGGSRGPVCGVQVAAVDDAIDAGRLPDAATFRKIVVVKVGGGTTEVKPNGDVYRSEVY